MSHSLFNDEPFPVQHNVDAKRNWIELLTDLKKEGITSLVVGGDIGEASVHPWFFDTLKGFSFQLTLGNHDSYSDVVKQAPLTTLGSGEHYHADEDDAFKYIYLDSSSDSISRQQLQWLQEELKTEKNIALFIHHPVLPVDTKVDHKYPLQNREEVKACLIKSGREIAIFCGHYHLAHEQVVGRIRQFISPAASFQMLKSAEEIVIDGSRYGYCIIQFNRDGSVETEIKLFHAGGLPDGQPGHQQPEDGR